MGLGWFQKDVGIDLGTANTLIFVKGKGIVLNEPSVIAVDVNSKKVLAVGDKAKDMLGKAPDHIKVIRPLQDGVISDFDMTAVMLEEFLKKSLEKGLFSSLRVVVGVPSGVTEVEKRAVEEVVRQMGAKSVYIIDEPMAAAIGVGFQVEDAKGCMIVDIGGGTSDIAIISLGGIVTGISLRHAGDKLTEAIILYMRKTYQLLIGEKTAEEIKIKIGCAYDLGSKVDFITNMDVRGRDLMTGLPKSLTVNSLDMIKALEEPVSVIVDGIMQALEQTPPEISADISQTGIMLSGGGALLSGLDKLIEKTTGIKTSVAENPLEAVVQGTGVSVNFLERIQMHSKKMAPYSN